MAHIAKYKAPSCGHMLAHYTRSKDVVLERENIDQSRTYLNYTVSHYQEDGRSYIGKVSGYASWETVRRRIESVQDATGRKVRKDAVVMADMVVTAPQNVPERDLERFFFLCYQYMAQQVGIKNLMGGYVHMDETTPHMHIPFTPIKDGKFNYKGLCPRAFYQQFHKGLGDHLEKQLGYRPEIELGEERKEEKVLSSVPQAQLNQARTAVLEPLERERDALAADYARKAAELEAVKRELAMMEEQSQVLNREIYDLRKERSYEQDRLEELQQRTGEVAGRVEQLQSVVADVRGFQDASRSEKGAILSRIAERCDGIRSAVMERKAELGKAVSHLRNRVNSAVRQISELRELNVPAPPPRRQESLRESLDRARAASAAMNRSGYSRGYSPGRGR